MEHHEHLYRIKAVAVYSIFLFLSVIISVVIFCSQFYLFNNNLRLAIVSCGITLLAMWFIRFDMILYYGAHNKTCKTKYINTWLEVSNFKTTAIFIGVLIQTIIVLCIVKEDSLYTYILSFAEILFLSI